MAAAGKPRLSQKEWSQQVTTRFTQSSANSGKWSKQLSPWSISYNGSCKLAFNLSISQFKHIGVFPEQSSNWEYIFSALQRKRNSKALNLFAYTGGASLVAKAVKSDITHVEAFSQLISKAKENMESSGLSDVRWMKEDALSYVQKEVKRGKKYDLIIMDPPSWGRGPKGEKWKLEIQLDDLIKGVSALLNKKAYIIVNTYSGISPEQLKERLENHISFASVECGNLIVEATSGSEFSTGSLVRGQVR
ncbi:MAG: class I SAM-dependent methyltransferase [Flavobacteriales bacterium]